jgi:hypothetical protein
MDGDGHRPDGQLNKGDPLNTQKVLQRTGSVPGLRARVITTYSAISTGFLQTLFCSHSQNKQIAKKFQSLNSKR